MFPVWRLGVHLDSPDNLMEILIQVEEMEQSVQETKRKFQELKAERDEAKKALDNMVMIEEVREEAVRLQKVLAWCAFRGIEQTAEALEERVARAPALAAQLDAELQQAQDAADKLEGVSTEQVCCKTRTLLQGLEIAVPTSVMLSTTCHYARQGL
jgi:hypothetical protein